jgi:hypothetical protein
MSGAQCDEWDFIKPVRIIAVVLFEDYHESHVRKLFAIEILDYRSSNYSFKVYHICYCIVICCICWESI